MEVINSYPFIGCSSEKIQQIGKRIGILYYPDGKFDVYFGEKVDEKFKGILCYFLFLTRQIDCFNSENKNSNVAMYSVNTYLDTILMNINEFVSLCKKNQMFLNHDDFLSCIIQRDEFYNYRYFSSVIELLMNDFYYVDAYSTNSGVNYVKKIDGNLTDYVSCILDNEYGFGHSTFKCKKLSKRI